jgi:hypothetical protein
MLRDLRLRHRFTFRRSRIANPCVSDEPLVLHAAARAVGFAEKYWDCAKYLIFDVSAGENCLSCCRTTDHKHVHTASSSLVSDGRSARVRRDDNRYVTIQRF